MAITPSRIALAMCDLQACLCAALTERGAGPVCWCGLWHGEEVSWDFCGECEDDVCGMAWVRQVLAGPSEAFPEFTLDPNCRKPLAYAIEVGAVRCMPTMESDGMLPAPEDITAATMGMIADQEAMRYALSCCDSQYITELALDTYVPLGPNGACAGGTWTFWIAVE